MNACDIAFGIEFETTLPTTDATPIGSYHHGVQVPWLPEGWRAERDGSIRVAAGRKACEFVSPKLRGAEGLAQAVASIAAIRSHGAKVNETCGLHITVEWNGDASALARLISLVGNHELAIFASTGTRRREIITYTKRIKHYGNKEDAKRRCESDRYHLLNLTHLARGQNRIEFRAFAGTLNATKVIGYVMLVLGLVELALNSRRCLDWNYEKREGTKSAWDRESAGAGETEVNRLFYRLGWTKGHSSRVYGLVGAPDLGKVKAKIRDLARKYDGPRA